MMSLTHSLLLIMMGHSIVISEDVRAINNTLLTLTSSSTTRSHSHHHGPKPDKLHPSPEDAPPAEAFVKFRAFCSEKDVLQNQHEQIRIVYDYVGWEVHDDVEYVLIRLCQKSSVLPAQWTLITDPQFVKLASSVGPKHKDLFFYTMEHALYVMASNPSDYNFPV